MNILMAFFMVALADSAMVVGAPYPNHTQLSFACVSLDIPCRLKLEGLAAPIRTEGAQYACRDMRIGYAYGSMAPTGRGIPENEVKFLWVDSTQVKIWTYSISKKEEYPYIVVLYALNPCHCRKAPIPDNLYSLEYPLAVGAACRTEEIRDGVLEAFKNVRILERAEGCH